MMNLSIRIKALLLLTLFAVIPLVVVVWRILPSYGQAIRESEQRNQLVATSDIRGEIERSIQRAEQDTQAVANAIAAAVENRASQEVVDAVIRGVLQSSVSINAVRFEVPAAKVDTVIAKKGADASRVPRSDEPLRQVAREHGLAFKVIEPSLGAIVVALPRASNEKAVQGYVVAPVYLRVLTTALKNAASTSSLDKQHSHILVTDEARRVVATYQVPEIEVGSDASPLPLWKSLPQASRGEQVGVKLEVEMAGEPSIATIQTVKDLGWAVAVWRPEHAVLANYNRMRQLLLVLVLGASVLAMLVGYWSARTITKPVLDLQQQAALIGQRRWSAVKAPPARVDELGELGRAMHTMANDLEQGENELARETQLRADLSRFMSQEVVEGIVKGEHPLELGGQRTEITVLFADMVAFTSAAEERSPETVVAMLNELFTVLTEVVFRHGGTVDKFIGDCLMAVWGAPLKDAEHAQHALEAAEDMMNFLEAASEQWLEKYGVEVRLAIGVNSGEAIVGNIGSSKRMEYTVVGDMVNVAARLESIAAPNQVLVGENTYARTADEFDMRLLGERKLTGRTQTIKVYELQTD